MRVDPAVDPAAVRQKLTWGGGVQVQPAYSHLPPNAIPGQMQFPIAPGPTYPEAPSETPPGIIGHCICPGIAFGGRCE